MGVTFDESTEGYGSIPSNPKKQDASPLRKGEVDLDGDGVADGSFEEFLRGMG